MHCDASTSSATLHHLCAWTLAGRHVPKHDCKGHQSADVSPYLHMTEQQINNLAREAFDAPSWVVVDHAQDMVVHHVAVDQVAEDQSPV